MVKFQIAVMLLEKAAEPNMGDWSKNSPLHRAAVKGHVKMTKLLLSYMADPNFEDAEGNSPL